MLDSRDPDISVVAARCGSDTLRLEPEWPTVLRWMRRLGRVEARTLNESARFEQAGRFALPEFYAPGRAFVGGDFALSCRLDRWKAIFATIDERGRRSLLLFDGAGSPLGAIDVNDPVGRPGFDEMVWRLHARDQTPVEAIARPVARPSRSDAEIDVEALAAALAGARGSRERAAVLRRFDVGREQSLRLASPASAWRVRTETVRSFLRALAERRLDVGCAIGNAGTIHAHVGRMTAVDGVARWTATFATHAKLTLDAASIASAWIVRVPGSITSSLELFGRAGEPVASVGSVRGPDGTEPLEWRRLVASLVPFPRSA